MISPFPLIGAAWTFAQKHTVLRAIGIWFFFVPMAGINILMRFLETLQRQTEQTGDPTPIVASIVAMLALSVVTMWGLACVLVIGKRMLQHSAGRTRTSFKAVTHQGAPFIIPLLLTSLLRGCFTFLWALLLVIPGILYALSTSFYPVIVVCEGKAYRAALQQSKAVLKGQWWRGILSLIAVGIVLFAPPTILSGLLERFAPPAPTAVAVDLIDAALAGAAAILFTLSMIALYGKLKKTANG